MKKTSQQARQLNSQNIRNKHTRRVLAPKDSNVRDRRAERGIASIRRRLLPILKRNAVRRTALFGSFARGEGTLNSDLDILVEFKAGKSLLDLVALKLELEEKTGRQVDVNTYRALHPAIRERVLSEQVAIL